MENSKPIFNKRVAIALINKGNKLLDIRANLKVKHKDVFYFIDTEKLRNDLTEITSK